MRIGQYLYNSLEAVDTPPAVARRGLARTGAFFLFLSCDFIAVANIAHSETGTITSALGATLCAASSYVAFEGYSYGCSVSAQPPTVELVPIVAEASPSIDS